MRRLARLGGSAIKNPRKIPERRMNLSFDEDELLIRAVGDVGGFMGSRARRGAETGARRLRKDVFEVDLAVNMSPTAAADRAREVISEHGDVLDLETSDENPGTQIVGIVGSGAANFNPAVVTVTIRASADGSRLVIRGVAKEGLIRQRAGEKAARRVAAAMASGELISRWTDHERHKR
jgi:hypothetical protein